MRTAEMLKNLPENHRAYLETLKANIRKGSEMNKPDYVKEVRDIAKGYIRCLVECNVVKDFKTVWIWFTV